MLRPYKGKSEHNIRKKFDFFLFVWRDRAHILIHSTRNIFSVIAKHLYEFLLQIQNRTRWKKKSEKKKGSAAFHTKEKRKKVRKRENTQILLGNFRTSKNSTPLYLYFFLLFKINNQTKYYAQRPKHLTVVRFFLLLLLLVSII
jgi:hypothetical protein